MPGKVAVIIEGRNFYVGWRRSAPAMLIDTEGLLAAIAEQVDAELGPVHFLAIDAKYGTYDANAKARINDLAERMREAGAEIVMLPPRVKETKCAKCGEVAKHVSDKQTEAEMAVRAIQAADDGCDKIVLVTSSSDMLPIVRELTNYWDMKVYVASWVGSPVGSEMTDSVAGVVWLRGDAPWLYQDLGESEETIFVDELTSAVKQFDGGYVGLHYFLTRWRSDRMTPMTEIRSLLLNKLVEKGTVEIYDAPDGKKAVRPRVAA